MLEKSPFGDKMIQGFSPKELKLLTPSKTNKKCTETQDISFDEEYG